MLELRYIAALNVTQRRTRLPQIIIIIILEKKSHFYEHRSQLSWSYKIGLREWKRPRMSSKCRSLVVTKSSAPCLPTHSEKLPPTQKKKKPSYKHEQQRDREMVGCGDLSFWDHYSKP